MSEEPNEYKDSIYRIIGDNIELLKNVLAEYRAVRAENKLYIDDLIKNNNTLKTNLELVKEASLLTKDLKEKSDIESHEKAKEALLLWCLIFCEKRLISEYNSYKRNNREAIDYGAKLGTITCFEYIRDAINNHFADSREKNVFVLGKSSVRQYMYNIAYFKVCSEFKKIYKDSIELEVTPEIEQRCKKNGIEVNKFMKDLAKEYRNDGLYVIESKKKPTKKNPNPETKYYIERNMPLTFSSKDNENETWDISETLKIQIEEIETEARKLMDQYTLVNEVRNILAYAEQSGDFSELELVLIKLYLAEDVNLSKIHQEWKDKKTKDCPENIYDFRGNAFIKLQNVMELKPEWKGLCDLV